MVLKLKLMMQLVRKLIEKFRPLFPNGSAAVSVTTNGTTKNADGVDVTDYAVDLSQATKR